MTATEAILVLALGIAIGYRLPGPVARLKALYRRHTEKPVLLRPFNPGNDATAHSARKEP